MAQSKYSDETKAAVMAALLQGQSVSSVAKQYKIPKGTVSSWKHKAQGVGNVSTQKREAISDLLGELLVTNLQAAKTVIETIADPAYIKRQSASEIAVLWGVINDKTFRMLEAFGESDDDVEDSDPDH